MVFMAETILLAQETFGTLNSFNPNSLLDQLKDAKTILDSAETLGLIAVLNPEQQQPMREFLASIPPGVDAGAMAAIRSALGRGLHVAVSWQPAYDFELRVWDVSLEQGQNQPWRGLVNVHISSPHPVEASPSP
jgi:hypothetical protein